MRAPKCKMLPELLSLLITLFSILLGFFIGLSMTRLYKVQTTTFYSASQSSNPGLQFGSSSENHESHKIYAATNPHGAERLPPGMVKAQSDLFLHGCVGNETFKKQSYLLALAVGIRQKNIVDKIVSKFSENFTIILFHYDGKTSEWDQFEWSQRAIHISAFEQTKWWYAKRFLHPNIVALYEYIFIWDEDLGVEHFKAEEYIKLVKKYDLEISQPAVISERGLIWELTQKRKNVEVHRQAESHYNCTNPSLPPCAGFVEIMAPVFSRNAWKCVWNMIQNDLVHGWGLDFAFWRCFEKPEEKIGVVDAQWIQHMVLPTLRHQVRARSFAEWAEFEKRMKAAA
ncbi:uncharacterized protein LOC105157841 [Sesamum indicum]|uniref:Uncharacterized protein LOC105157841 n=1 Tax=Sesamum indicum TaxID=4182 RepID=A0A8M8UMR4_SESIN|nr:uncharacterized protein LOC105157841 [Sesamum indicum]